MFKIDFFSQNADQLTQLAKQKLAGEVEAWEKNIWQFITDWFDLKIETIQISTSGSTGAPRLIEHAKQAMINSATATCAALNLQTGINALLCLPANKIGGMMMIVRSIQHKMALYCIKPSTTPLSDIHSEWNINFAAFTPMQFHQITDNNAASVTAGNIAKVLLGGEDVKGDLLSAIADLKNEVYISFGMTETISHIALKRLNGRVADRYFKVLPGIAITTDERGCLVIKAPAIGQPYLVTNDIVNIISETEFEWLGRIDNVINTGGIKIYPETIERKLIADVEYPFFISSLPDKLTGQKLVMVIDAVDLQPDQLSKLKASFAKLDKYERPKELLLISSFVRPENGKLKRTQTLQKKALAISI